MDSKQLSSEIENFLSTFADKSTDFDPEYDDEEEQFASPDASILFTAAYFLKTEGSLPKHFSIDSSWESGGYRPYSDKIGRSLHDSIIEKCKEFKAS